MIADLWFQLEVEPTSAHACLIYDDADFFIRPSTGCITLKASDITTQPGLNREEEANKTSLVSSDKVTMQ